MDLRREPAVVARAVAGLILAASLAVLPAWLSRVTPGHAPVPPAGGAPRGPLALAAPAAGVEGDALVRFHVIANSDSAADQALKRRVRDAVLARAWPDLSGAASARAAEQLLRSAMPAVQRVAEQAVRDAGSSQPVHLVLGRTWFPAKQVGEIVLPPGDYLALRLILGRGEGHNWWCVAFPPLCLLQVEEAYNAAGGRSAAAQDTPQASRHAFQLQEAALDLTPRASLAWEGQPAEPPRQRPAATGSPIPQASQDASRAAAAAGASAGAGRWQVRWAAAELLESARQALNRRLIGTGWALLP